MLIHAVHITNSRHDVECTFDGLARYLSRVRALTAFQACARLSSKCYIVVAPWESEGETCGIVFVLGEGFLALRIAEELTMRMPGERYTVTYSAHAMPILQEAVERLAN